MIQQDYLYLLDSVKFKALRFAKLNSCTPVSEILDQSTKITSAVTYAEEWKKICTDQLGIPKAEMENIESSAAEIGYASFLQSRVFLDDWFSLYIITIPCVYVRNHTQVYMKGSLVLMAFIGMVSNC